MSLAVSAKALSRRLGSLLEWLARIDTKSHRTTSQTEDARRKTTKKTMSNDTTTPENAPTARVDQNFFKIKKVKVKVTPFEPALRLYPRKFLELERVNRRKEAHVGGIDTEVTVADFMSPDYGLLILELARERRRMIGVDPSKITYSEMKNRLHDFYDQEFRGETGLLQVIVAEYRWSKHLHGKRPANTYCYKCRLLLEVNYLARPWLYPGKLPDDMLWYNSSDLDSEDDQEKRQDLKDTRKLTLANMRRQRLGRRSPRARKVSVRRTVIAGAAIGQTTSPGVNVVPSQAGGTSQTSRGAVVIGSSGTAQTADPNVGQKDDTVEKLLKQVRELSKAVLELTPKKKSKTG